MKLVYDWFLLNDAYDRNHQEKGQNKFDYPQWKGQFSRVCSRQRNNDVLDKTNRIPAWNSSLLLIYVSVRWSLDVTHDLREPFVYKEKQL